MLEPAPGGGRPAQGWGPAGRAMGIHTLESKVLYCCATKAGDSSDFQAL